MTSGSPTSGVGRVIAGRYLLLHRLGVGGMSHVWLAHDQRLACEVALKEIVLRDSGETAQERAARVSRARARARHAAGLRGHPHVVTVHDVLEHDGLPWMVMEYVAGAVDLRDLVARRGPLAPAECARVGLAVLDALTAGHERGITHRDVNPANILLAPDRTGAPYGRILLTGHGISVQPDTGETRHTTAAPTGTAGCAAPERITGGPSGPAADLFSLGCTLYHGVEGHGPFDRESPLAQISAVVAEEPRPAVRAGALEPVLRALLAKDPARRMTATAAGAALARIVTPQADGRPPTRHELGPRPRWTEASALPPVATGAPAAPAPPPVPGRPLSHALRAAASTGLGLLLALGAVWYALAGRTADAEAAPYGRAVGLAAPLRTGDCVVADWPGAARFSGTPRLSLDPTCRDGAPDGQVMAFAEAASANEARATGPARCEELTRETRARLADVRSYAVVPTSAGFVPAEGRAACLVLGAHGPVYGPLAGHRRPGAAFTDTATMQKRDCLDVRSDRDVRLASCASRHDEQVLGFTRLAAGLTLAQARTRSDTACAREVPPADYGFDPSVYEAGSWTGEGAWKSATHLVVCTVRKQNGGTMEGDEP
ncbi:serine/threonine-protein kinase [Streptomyces cadmiisoli]|uniref:serine/threonine-protein kinase n=1 Tax=Streptomyces cadmiisoli TaxID=2184053 RepID=UPI003658C15B